MRTSPRFEAYEMVPMGTRQRVFVLGVATGFIAAALLAVVLGPLWFT